MSELMLTIKDAQRAIFQTVHLSVVDVFVAALADDPDTIEELEIAAALYSATGGREKISDRFYSGVGKAPWDAGMLVVDMEARIIACEAEGYRPQRLGSVRFHDGESATELDLPYLLPEDWLLLDSLDYWRREGPFRAERLRSLPSFDVRAVLYQTLPDFLVRECREAHKASLECPFSSIHAKWLMTPRDDLRGHSPRELLLMKRDTIEWGCEARARLWSFNGERPSGLPRSTRSFRMALFGTHENILYYELIRYLLEEYWQVLKQGKAGSLEEDMKELNRQKDLWLKTPSEDYEGLSPAVIIDRERERMPIAFEASRAMIDPECPLCQSLEGETGPMFWHLDGCNMENDFPFSFFRTRAEWEEDERKMEASISEFNRNRSGQTDSPD
jgi:hypothetical protein